MKHRWILFSLLLAFSACDDDSSVFEASPDGLDIRFTPVAGGAMMHYTLPDNPDIFNLNIRYENSQGKEVLKASDYGSDSLLLDGFTRNQEDVVARLSFVNNRHEESAPLEYRFSTLDSAPWAFFDSIEVKPSWDGFQVIYKTPEVVTGMVHFFYVGENPMTHQPDTILVNSTPIRAGGDTVSFKLLQEHSKNTVVVRTEDFQGYRVKQEIFPDVDAFRTEQWKVTADDFNDFGKEQKDDEALTGKKYLFDGELKGRERMQAYLTTPDIVGRYGIIQYGTYVAGPDMPGKPMVIDLREQKVPAWVRLYCLIPLKAIHPAGADKPLGTVWNDWYDDKLPCKLTVYGHRDNADPTAEGWELLGSLNQDPKAETEKEKWSYRTLQTTLDSPRDMPEFEQKKPIFVDVPFPAIDNTYRYLKIVVHEMFNTNPRGIECNKAKYITLHELEVFVKKN